MKVKLDEFWEVDQEDVGVCLYHCGEPHTVIDFDTALKLADQIMAWNVEEVFTNEVKVAIDDGEIEANRQEE